MGLRPVEKDLLTELNNISMGSAATALASLLNKVVSISIPEIVEAATADWQKRYNKSGFLTRIVFEKGLDGSEFLFFPDEDAALLASLLLGKEDLPLQAVGVPELGAINEALSIITGAYSASLGNFLSLDLELSQPQAEGVNPAEKDLAALGFVETESWVELCFVLEIDGDKHVNMIKFVPVSFLRLILNPILEGMGISVTDSDSDASDGQEAPVAVDGSSKESDADAVTGTGDSADSLDNYLSAKEKDVLGEVGNISLGASATALSQLVSRSVHITTPKLSLATVESLKEQYPLSNVYARVNYQEGLKGESILILKNEDVALIAALMMGGLTEGDELPEVGEMEMSAISEAMNQMMGSAATAMSNFLDRKVDISPPNLSHIDLHKESLQISQVQPGESFLQISFQMEIENALQSQIVQLLPFPFAKGIASFLLKDLMDEASAGSDSDAGPAPAGDAAGDKDEDKDVLNDMQKDALAEMGNISLGFSATALSELIDKKVHISAPRVIMTNMKEVSAKYPIPCLVVMVNYVKGIDGNNVLIVKKEDALVIVGLMLGMEPPEKPEELGEIEMSAISEAMNQMMGSASTAMSDLLERLIDISPPELVYKDLNVDTLEIASYSEDSPLIQVSFRMEVEGLIDSEIFQLIPLEFAKEITSFLLSTVEELETQDMDDSEADKSAEKESAPVPAPAASAPPPAAAAAAAQQGKKEELYVANSAALVKEQTQAFRSPPDALALSLGSDEYAKLNLIRDIPLEIRAVLGKARVPLKKIFSLLPGETISLNRFLGEPVELLAHEHLVATGEVVMVNGQFGIKITEIVRS